MIPSAPQEGGNHNVLSDYMDMLTAGLATAAQLNADILGAMLVQSRGTAAPALVAFDSWKTVGRWLERSETLLLVLFNSMAQTRNEVIHLAVPVSGLAVLNASTMAPMQSQLVIKENWAPTHTSVIASGAGSPFNSLLSVPVTLPPLGFQRRKQQQKNQKPETVPF